MITRPATSPVVLATLISVVAAVLGVAGCVGPRAGASDNPTTSAATTGAASTSPAAGESTAAAGESPAATATAGPTANASPPSTTETAWGRIWDGLPAAFPVYPGAVPADGGEGPASAVVAVPDKVDEVVSWYRQALVAAGYSIEALAGPMEDGSTVIDAVGLEPTCRVQTSIGPRGTQIVVSILFAAACPFG